MSRYFCFPALACQKVCDVLAELPMRVCVVGAAAKYMYQVNRSFYLFMRTTGGILRIGRRMKPTITVLLVLVIGSMLVGTAFAECAAMNMPCCAQHHNTTCHEICAAPTGNINRAAVPQLPIDLQSVVTARPVLPVPRIIAAHIQPTFKPSAEDLLMRIHVLLI